MTLQQQFDMLREAFNEWISKTDWVQTTYTVRELGKHRADVLRERIEALTVENEKLKRRANDWRALGMQFDGQRMTAIIHLKQAARQLPQGQLRDDIEQFLSAEPKPIAAPEDASRWGEYVATMVAGWLEMPVDDPRIKTMGEIIVRRLWALPGYNDDGRSRIEALEANNVRIVDALKETQEYLDVSQCPWCGGWGPEYRDTDRPLTYCQHDFTVKPWQMFAVTRGK